MNMQNVPSEKEKNNAPKARVKNRPAPEDPENTSKKRRKSGILSDFVDKNDDLW